MNQQYNPFGSGQGNNVPPQSGQNGQPNYTGSGEYPPNRPPYENNPYQQPYGAPNQNPQQSYYNAPPYGQQPYSPPPYGRPTYYQPPYGQQPYYGAPYGGPQYNSNIQQNYANVNNADAKSFAQHMQSEFERQQKIKAQKREIRRFGNSMGLAIIGYLVLQTIFSFMLEPLGLIEYYQNSSIFQNAFNLICVSVLSVALPFGIAAWANKDHYEHQLIPTKSITFPKLAMWVGFGMLCCIGANFVVSLGVIPLFRVFGFELRQSETSSPDSVFACIISLIATAVVPAICEEFAMRCCGGQLLRKYGKPFAVFAVSIVFGLLHGNVIQFVFAFLVGLVLGFVTVKTDSILPALLIHAMNNGMSVVSDIMTYAVSEKAGETSTMVLYVFWLVAGIAATVLLAVKNELKVEKEPAPKDDAALTFGQKMASFFFVPCMIIPLLSLIFFTLTTIEKI